MAVSQWAPEQFTHVFHLLSLRWSIPELPIQIELVIGVGAIVLAEDRFGSIAKKIESSARKAEKRLVRMGEALTNRSIDDFPAHIDRITQLISQARSEVMILGDCVDYGSFRKYESHANLVKAICEKRREIEGIRFLVWNTPRSLSRANKFSDDKFRAEHGKEEFVKCINNFLSKLERYEPDLARRSATAFEKVRNFANDKSIDWGDRDGTPYQWLRKVQIEFHNKVQLVKLRNAKVKPIIFEPNETVPLDQKQSFTNEEQDPPPPEYLFWIVDDVAIMIIPFPGEDATALETGDQNLIKRLRKIFEWRYKYAEERIKKHNQGQAAA
jgi:hypothetical protein